MNRTRINQMLGVLLFPFLDPALQKEDCFRKRYEKYKAYMKISEAHAADFVRKKSGEQAFQKATKDLIEYLKSKSGAGIRSYDDLLMLCEFYYPLTDIEHSEKSVKDGVLNCYYNNLWKIAESLLTYRDGIIAIRFWNTDGNDIFNSPDVFDKVQIWNMLCCYMVPDVLIVAFAVRCNLSIEVLYEQKPYISLADKLFVKILQKGMAENHLHFNAGFDYEAIWLNNMNLARLFRDYATKDSIEEEKREKLWAAALFRILAAKFFISREERESRDFVSWVEEQEGEEARMILERLLSGEMKNSIAKTAEKCEWLRSVIASHEKVNETDYLLAGIFKEYVELKTSSEFILLFFCITYLKKVRDDERFARIFLQYLRIKNERFRYILQNKLIPGLRHFQNYYNTAKQAESALVGKAGLALDVFRAQAKQTYLKKLEIRIAPDIEIYKLSDMSHRNKEYIRQKLCGQLFQIFFLYRRYLFESVMGVSEANRILGLEEREALKGNFSYKEALKKISENSLEGEKKVAVPTMGIVYHLLKAESLENISGYSCARESAREGGFHRSHRLFRREVMAQITEMIEELRGEIPFINEYVVGLDAASDENAMEPWMFAPAYNRMRRKERTNPVIRIGRGDKLYSTIQNMGFTYHVGEDFRHVASGLRHVDEVVENFHYKAGDRLGHAIVLGTDIGKWVREREMVVLPLGEHLDNLLWIWGKAVYERVNLSVQFERLEKEILECAKEIYGNNNGEITVMMLYEAYKLKFAKEHKGIIDKLNREIEKRSGVTEGKRKNVKGYCKYMGYDCGACNGNWQLWDEEKLIYTSYCPVFEGNRDRVIPCTIEESDIIVYKELQEYLLNKIEQKGIYVEANPTSNVTIGEDIEDLRDHPIFRMNSLSSGGHHVMVTVNSDDPAVFNTNVENELSYIYHAMGRGNYPKEDILNWIDKIRQNGMDASFVHKVKDTGTLLEEVSSILDELQMYK